MSHVLDVEPVYGDEDIPANTITSNVSVGVQTTISQRHKCTQVYEKQIKIVGMTFDTNKKLKSLAGIPSQAHLEALIKMCNVVRPEEHYNSVMDYKNRILLTMAKLKLNLSNVALANIFKITERTSQKYFADTIQLLAKVLECFIYWPTKEENQRSLVSVFCEIS